MVARSRARYLAPIALVATITATYFVVHGSIGSKHTTTAPRGVVLPTRTAKPRPAPAPSVYVVKPGDSLSAISVKTKVPVAKLESLNPGIDPNALQAGQRLTLRK